MVSDARLKEWKNNEERLKNLILRFREVELNATQLKFYNREQNKEITFNELSKKLNEFPPSMTHIKILIEFFNQIPTHYDSLLTVIEGFLLPVINDTEEVENLKDSYEAKIKEQQKEIMRLHNIIIEIASGRPTPKKKVNNKPIKVELTKKIGEAKEDDQGTTQFMEEEDF